MIAGVLFDGHADNAFGLPELSVRTPGAAFAPGTVAFSIEESGPAEIIAHFAPLPPPEVVLG